MTSLDSQKNTLQLGLSMSAGNLDQNNDETRLWIGNLDGRITEYQLIKVLQKFGKVTKFDFLFHKSGPLQGQPRGYCFVTFENKLEAMKALQSLDGHAMLSKKLSVKWAHLKIKDEDETKNMKKIIPGLSGLPKQESDISLTTKIRAIEAKLKLMEENKNEENLIIYPQSTCSSKAPVVHKKHKFIHNTRPYQKHRTSFRFQK